MKTITKYEAKDGSEFSSESACLSYENRLNKADKIMSRLKPLPKDSHCDFANGGGYLQQDLALVKECAEDILELVKGCIGNSLYNEIKGKAFKARFGIVGRYLCDGDHPANRAWCRLGHIDNQGKEWGQGYYAINPSKGKQQEYKEKR
jgi:hypothetical protein